MRWIFVVALILFPWTVYANQCLLYDDFLTQVGSFLQQHVDDKLLILETSLASSSAIATSYTDSKYAILEANISSSTATIQGLQTSIAALNTDLGQLTVKYDAASSSIGTLSAGLDFASSSIQHVNLLIASTSERIDGIVVRLDYASTTLEGLRIDLETASTSLRAVFDLFASSQATATAETLQSILLLQASSTDHELRITNLENMTYVPPGSSGASDKVEKSITQTAHGFTVGQWVYLSAASTYALADNDLPTTADVVGVVTAVADANTFTLQTGGYVTGLTGLTATAAHFLSSTAGAITATEPTGSSQTRKPVLIADTTTSGWIIDRTGTPVNGQTAVTNSGENTSITDAQTTTSTSYVDVAGSSFTLPVAGTYAVFYTVSTANSTATADTQYSLADNTNTLVPNSEYKVRAASNGNNVVLTSSRILITTTGAATYKLRWKVDAGTATITNTSAGAEASGSKISWVQIGGTPVPMSLAGEYGEFVYSGAGVTVTAGTNSGTSVAFMSFTIPSAGVWRISPVVRSTTSSNIAATTDRELSYALYDNANTLIPNTEVSGFEYGIGASPSIRASSSGGAGWFVTTSGAATYQVRVWNQGATAHAVGSDADGRSRVTYEKISGFTPTSGQTVDYVNVRRAAANYVTTSGSGYRFDTTVSGNIPYDSTTGNFTLTAGKTYRLEGEIQLNASNAQAEYRWFDVTANTAIGNNSLVASADAAAGNSSTPHALAIITPSVTTQVQLRPNFSANTNANANYSYAQITQLGSTSNTVGSLPATDQSSAGYFDIGNMRIQWGKTASVGDTDQTITFPFPFATPPSVTCNTELTTGTNAAYGVGLKTITTTTFLANRDDTISDADGPFFNWVAIGMKP